LSKYCLKCNTELFDDEAVCPKCNTASKVEKHEHNMLVIPKNKKSLKKLAVILGIFVCFAAIVISVIAYCNNKAIVWSDVFKSKQGNVVVTIDGEEIREDMFKFLSTMVLNEYDEIYDYYGTDEFETKLKEQTILYAQEYVCRWHEAEDAGYKLSKDDKKVIETALDNLYDKYKTKDMSERRFYSVYYGISKQQMVEYSRNSQLSLNYGNKEKEKATYTEEDKLAAYGVFSDYIAGCKANVIVINTTGLATEQINEKKNIADSMLASLEGGVSMKTIAAQYSNDTTVSMMQDEMHVNASVDAKFQKIYDWSKDVAVGSSSAIYIDSTDDAGNEISEIYIVQCSDILEYADVSDSEELINITKFYIVNLNINELMKSDKYAAKINEDVYSTVSIG